MVSKIAIQNFKSIDKLEIELGRLNVFIGANGSGKSNLLEGIAMGAAGIADKLEHEFLSTRIRVTSPKFMMSAFESEEKKDSITNLLTTKSPTGDTVTVQTVLEYVNKTWVLKDISLKTNKSEISISDISKKISRMVVDDAENDDLLAKIENLLQRAKNSKHHDDVNEEYFDSLLQMKKTITENVIFFQKARPTFTANEKYYKQIVDSISEKTNIKNFLIFAPENHFLRNFNEESQIRPLGLRGEGLFNHISELHEEKPALFAKINEQLRVLDWFDGFEMPNDLKFTEKRIRIKDNYLQPDLSYFDQRSANEGFLYLLFYFTLFVSDETPSFFAIDNIDNAMNPKLGRQLVKTLAELAKQHQKQAILTTHNPAILDGLNLDDDEQRLFVVYRNADGQTRVRRIFKKNTPKNASLPLSEMFLRGYLGGLPNNF